MALCTTVKERAGSIEVNKQILGMGAYRIDVAALLAGYQRARIHLIFLLVISFSIDGSGVFLVGVGQGFQHIFSTHRYQLPSTSVLTHNSVD